MIAIFVQNLDHAKYVVKQKKYRAKNYFLITNNLSVFCFLKDVKKINCVNLEEKITTQKNLSYFKVIFM